MISLSHRPHILPSFYKCSVLVSYAAQSTYHDMWRYIAQNTVAIQKGLNFLRWPVEFDSWQLVQSSRETHTQIMLHIYTCFPAYIYRYCEEHTQCSRHLITTSIIPHFRGACLPPVLNILLSPSLRDSRGALLWWCGDGRDMLLIVVRCCFGGKLCKPKWLKLQSSEVIPGVMS